MTLGAGLGFKPGHFDEATICSAEGLWFEVHAENYMVDGGSRLAALDVLRGRHPVSLHAVGLSIASSEPPDAVHLERLVRLVERVRPVAVSDHLAWNRWGGVHHADFLPFPRTFEALDRVADNVARIQDRIGMALLIENPSLYVDLPGRQLSEIGFLEVLAARTGCGLLLDVNNAFVSASNLGFSAQAYIDAVPGELVGEIHLAGHAPDPDSTSPLIVDSHDRPIDERVWGLYRRLIDRIGPRPTLIERDGDVPPFRELMIERDRAHRLLAADEVGADNARL